MSFRFFLFPFLKRFYYCKRAATSLEFALLLPVFILLLFGVIELGRLFWTQSTLDYAVEETARYAVVTPSATATQLQSYAASKAYQLTPTPTFTATINSTVTAIDVTVQGSYPYTFLVIPLNNITLTSTSHYKI